MDKEHTFTTEQVQDLADVLAVGAVALRRATGNEDDLIAALLDGSALGLLNRVHGIPDEEDD